MAATTTLQSTQVSFDIALRVKIRSDRFGNLALTATLFSLDKTLALINTLLAFLHSLLFWFTWGAIRTGQAAGRTVGRAYVRLVWALAKPLAFKRDFYLIC